MTLAMALASALRGASCDARATTRKLLRREPAGASRPVHREHLSSGVSEALVRRVARRDGGVAVTFANDGMYDFVVNWCEHADEIGITNYLVGAMDESLYGRLRKIGVNAWLMGSKNIDDDEVAKDFGWGSKNFHKMGRDKIRLVHELTKTGFDVIVTDVDAVWLRDPFPFLRRYPKADALVSIDNLRNHTSVVATQANHAVDGEGLEHSACGGNKNIGIMWFRSTEGSQSFTQEWLNKLESNDKDWDQVVFNKLVDAGRVRNGARRERRRPGVWWRAHARSLAGGALCEWLHIFHRTSSRNVRLETVRCAHDVWLRRHGWEATSPARGEPVVRR